MNTKKFNDLKSAGVNRLSIGIQSFDDASLKALGRLHNSKNAKEAIKQAFRVGFEQINLDLMHSPTNQDSRMALNDLKTAAAFNTPHLSWYELTIEPNTAFYTAPKLPNEDTLSDIHQLGLLLLATQRNYQQYEVSTFCQNQNYAQHNLNYWRFGDCLAIGAGAHGKVSTDEGILRFNNTRAPKDYLNKKALIKQKKTIISPQEVLFDPTKWTKAQRRDRAQ